VNCLAQHPDVTNVCLIAVGHTVLRYTLKCNFIYAHKKWTDFLVPIFTEKIVILDLN